MDLKDVGEVIAVRKLHVVEEGKGSREIEVKIGKPVPYPFEDDYYCPFQVVGVGSERVRYAVGIDAVQALQLVMVALGSELYCLNRDSGGSLHWDAGGEGDFGFPRP
ncbi:MAG: DUF6968 family protein [Candidatus Acidiferrales bacterium]